MKFIVTFIILSIINVIFSTIRSIATIKSGKTVASLLSGGYFAFYNIMIVYTVADFPMWEKCLITFCCNVAGVWIVKFFEERAAKEKLWKIEATIPTKYLSAINRELREIPKSTITLSSKWTQFSFYCATKAESAKVRDIIKQYDAKFFVSESKSL
jgi:hypothetical protein